MTLTFNRAIQDGKLTSKTGRIVIYKQFIDISRGPGRDHNDLLRSLASKFRLPKDDVISNAIRLYWEPMSDGIVVCPVRRLDEDMFERRDDFHRKLILQNI